MDGTAEHRTSNIEHRTLNVEQGVEADRFGGEETNSLYQPPSVRCSTFNVQCSMFALVLVLALLTCLPCLAAEEKPVNFSGDDVRWAPEQTVSATGHVKVSYLDYTITADSVEADLQTNVAVFKGNVFLQTKGEKVTGASLKMNLKTREWTLENASSRIEPAVFQGMLTGAVYAHGNEVDGQTQNEIKILTGSLTTCDETPPHYAFKARDIEVYPGSRIIAHKVDIIGMGHKLFTLNTLLIPIKMLTRNLIPQVGSSVDEGSFIKSSIPYMATGTQQGYFKLDGMQKKGIGVGLDHAYKFGLANGNVDLYFLSNKQSGGRDITGRLQHHQKFGMLDVNLTTDYRSNDYLFLPTSKSSDWQMALMYGKALNTTALNLMSSTTTGFGTYTSSTASLRHTQQFNPALNGVFSLDFRSYDSAGINSSESLDSALQLRDREKKFDLSLAANKNTNLSNAGASTLGGLERLPELTFETDSFRLGKNSFLGLPSRLSVIAGQYRENPQGTNMGRLLFQWDMLDKAVDIGDRNMLNINGGVRQAFYQSNMAQYVLKGGATWTSTFSDYLKLRFNYNYQRPEGFSPFFFDTTGKYNYMRAVLDYQQDRKLRWSLSSGYDMYARTYNWQVLNLQATSHPNPFFGFAIGSGFDLNRSAWQSLLAQIQIGIPNHLTLDLGNRYDPQRHSLLSRGKIDWQVNRLWRLESISSWNGDIKKFDYQAFRVTHDLHCVEASVTYTNDVGFRTDRGFSFDIRIKALPFLDRFGINQYGQKIDTSLGQYLY